MSEKREGVASLEGPFKAVVKGRYQVKDGKDFTMIYFDHGSTVEILKCPGIPETIDNPIGVTETPEKELQPAEMLKKNGATGKKPMTTVTNESSSKNSSKTTTKDHVSLDKSISDNFILPDTITIRKKRVASKSGKPGHGTEGDNKH